MCGVDSGGEDNRIFLICVTDVIDASALLIITLHLAPQRGRSWHRWRQRRPTKAFISWVMTHATISCNGMGQAAAGRQQRQQVLVRATTPSFIC